MLTASMDHIINRATRISAYAFLARNQDRFFILTNADNDGNFKLVQAGDHTLGRDHWKNLIIVKKEEKIEDVELFKV